jgi:hypothetical protein
MRHDRGFAAHLKRSQLLFQCPIGEELVLPQVLGPVLRDERLDMPRCWRCRVSANGALRPGSTRYSTITMTGTPIARNVARDHWIRPVL